MSEAFKEYRSTLYKHYQKAGSPAEGRSNKDNNLILDEDWNILCDRWETDARKEKSAKNKAARGKLPFNHRAGSSPFLRLRKEKDKMIELKNAPVSEGSEPLTEAEIYETALGKRPGYIKGLGYGRKPSEMSTPSVSQADLEKDAEMERLKGVVNSPQAELDSLREEMRTFRAFMAQFQGGGSSSA